MDHPEEGERKSWGYLPIFLTRDATPASAHLLSSLMLESVRESYPFTELKMPRCASCFSAQLFVLLLRHCRGWQRVRDGFFVNFPFFRVTQFYKCAGQQLLYLEKRSVCACGGGWRCSGLHFTWMHLEQLTSALQHDPNIYTYRGSHNWLPLILPNLWTKMHLCVCTVYVCMYENTTVCHTVTGQVAPVDTPLV